MSPHVIKSCSFPVQTSVSFSKDVGTSAQGLEDRTRPTWAAPCPTPTPPGVFLHPFSPLSLPFCPMVIPCLRVHRTYSCKTGKTSSTLSAPRCLGPSQLSLAADHAPWTPWECPLPSGRGGSPVLLRALPLSVLLWVLIFCLSLKCP